MKTTKPVSFEDTSVAFSSKTNYRLFKMYLLFWAMSFNKLVKIGNNLVSFLFKIKFPIKGIIKYTVFEHFCGGETINESEATIRELADFNIGTILDYSVEGEKSIEGFDKTTAEIIKTIKKSGVSEDIPFSVFKVTGIASAELLEKLQTKSQLNEEEDRAFKRFRNRFLRICQAAYDNKTRILIDAEETWIQNTIDDLVYEMSLRFNKEEVVVYNTFQMYRKDMLSNLKSAHTTLLAKGAKLGAKLVRGAYMEKERERAKDKKYESPIHESKKETDDDYNAALEYCVKHLDSIGLCSGSHNEYSNEYLAILMENNQIETNHPGVFFAQLYGMSDNISFNLANHHYNVVKYVPYGPVKSVLPYLYRRSQENSSVAGQSSREFSYIKKEIKRRISAK